MSEYQRRLSNQDRVLALLKSRPRGVSNVELAAVGGLRFSGRVSDLRRLGHRIDVEHAEAGIWWYRYVSAPQPPYQVSLL